MKMRILLLFVIAINLIGCSKEKKIVDMLNGNFFGWKGNQFLINDIDKTDSLLNITITTQGAPWYYFFEPDGYNLGYINGNWGDGMWYLENKGEILRIRINQSYYQTPGPFLIEDVEIDWNLN